MGRREAGSCLRTFSMIQYAGKSDDGTPLFDAVVNIPDDGGDESRASRRQLEAIDRYYFGAVEDDLSEYQAHVLISCGKYGKAIADEQFLRTKQPIKRLLGAVLAAHCTDVPAIRSAVVDWSEGAFESGEDNIAACSAYGDLVTICCDLYSAMLRDGVEGVRMRD